ncbi:hypothetical protein CAEBREN_08991 [Caenorhabditis brenneri]|uniref:Cytochrome b561 domain-containing protein n=1 Tax=Caenorhabditis brenneri TaxID=135651 RepID=G0MTU3_CAEBE|nr:hypothetical protein CAEBREN_08991 [Caenorhabditis brenneri]
MSTKSIHSLGNFDFILTVTHLVGFITVCLSGYFFNTFMNGIGWPNQEEISNQSSLGMKGKQLHGFLMFLGFIYFQGEALLAYRVYRYNPRSVTKTIHSVFHFLAFGSGVAALVSMILSISFMKSSHFSNIHSWLGICFLVLFFGLVTFVFPCTPESYRARLMPVHRAVGISCMVISCIQCCLGYNQLVQKQLHCFKDLSCANRIEYVGALSMLFNILYTLLVLAVVTPKPWRREKTVNELN